MFKPRSPGCEGSDSGLACDSSGVIFPGSSDISHHIRGRARRGRTHPARAGGLASRETIVAAGESCELEL